MNGWARHFRSRLLTGLVVLLPAAISLWALYVMVRWVDDLLTLQVLNLAGKPYAGPLTVWLTRFASILLVLGLLYLVGLLAANVGGRRVLAWISAAVERVPLAGGIYRGTRQLVEAFGPGGTRAFRRCVLIEHPRRGAFSLGFVTSEGVSCPGDDRLRRVGVYIPTVPFLTSGVLVFVPAEDCRDLGISVEDGLKMIVSGGIVLPEELKATGEDGLSAEEKP